MACLYARASKLDDKRIFAQIVEVAKPRQAASVKKALEKKNLVAVSVGKLGGSKGRENQSR